MSNADRGSLLTLMQRVKAAAIHTDAPVPFKGEFVRVEFALELAREIVEARLERDAHAFARMRLEAVCPSPAAPPSPKAAPEK